MKAFDITIQSKTKIESLNFDNSIFGPVPDIFIGSKGYPNVFSGPMSSLYPDSKLTQFAGIPSFWTDLSLNEIIELRFGLLRGMKRSNINFNEFKTNKIIENLQEISIATNIVEAESMYTGRINPNVNLDNINSPLGPSAQLRNLKLTSNPKIPRIVENTLNDELKSNEQLNILYKNGLDIYYLQKIFSSGLTGQRENSKLVPTRWSITATDDIIGKSIIERLKDYRVIDSIVAFHGSFFGNYFTIVLFPDFWQFENFESWGKGSIFTLGINQKDFTIIADHEGNIGKERYKGKSTYSIQGGGYYAARLSILKYLDKMKIQAKVISFRETTSEYLVPAGVWVVRESSRIATESNPLKFESISELEEYLRHTLRTPLEDYYQKSTILAQKSLTDYF